jgi:rhamnogalacturonan endolyase
MKNILIFIFSLLPCLSIFATEARQNRGLIAFVNGNDVQVEWRMRASDDPTQTQYLLYIDGKLYGTFRSKTTVRVSKSRYENSVFSLVVKDKDGKEIDRQNDVKAWGSPCLDIPMTAPVIKGKADTAIVRYEPSDASAYDMDGDGEQEIIMKWASAWAGKDATAADHHQFVDCYKLNGQRLWRIDFGQNGIEGNNFNFEVSDFDGDGKGEMIVKTAPGCKDGLGNYVGKGLKGYPDDLEKTYKRGSDGGPVSGEEWVTCFDGTTGKELATRQYWPYFSIQTNWDNRPNHEDGQNYGRRGNGFKSAVIRIPCRDGQVRPCCYLQRGIYTYVYATAISWDGKNLVEEWRHGSTATNSSFTENATGKHTQTISLMSQGAHQGQAGDIDGDGYDEVMIGAVAIDHDGTVLWSTGLGHGDAVGVGDFNLDNPGLEAWRITEVSTKYDACMMDGKTGEVMNGQLYTKGDVGRGVIMDLDSTSAGSEYWFMTDGGKMYDQNGKVLYIYSRGNGTGYPSFRIFWDGDLLDEHFDGDKVSKFDLASHSWVRSTFYRKTDGKNLFYKRYSVFSINSTKKNACLQCDLLGDFREELVMPARAQDLKRTDCDYVLRVITTTFDTDKKLPWLRDDYLYNLQISNQNVGYSMPPHLSYNAYAWYKSLPAMGKDEIGKKSTGIDRVSTDASASETWYDLSGRRVAKPRTPGVYVRNGKKVVIK